MWKELSSGKIGYRAGASFFGIMGLLTTVAHGEKPGQEKQTEIPHVVALPGYTGRVIVDVQQLMKSGNQSMDAFKELRLTLPDNMTAYYGTSLLVWGDSDNPDSYYWLKQEESSVVIQNRKSEEVRNFPTPEGWRISIDDVLRVKNDRVLALPSQDQAEVEGEFQYGFFNLNTGQIEDVETISLGRGKYRINWGRVSPDQETLVFYVWDMTTDSTQSLVYWYNIPEKKLTTLNTAGPINNADRSLNRKGIDADSFAQYPHSTGYLMIRANYFKDTPRGEVRYRSYFVYKSDGTFTDQLDVEQNGQSWEDESGRIISIPLEINDDYSGAKLSLYELNDSGRFELRWATEEEMAALYVFSDEVVFADTSRKLEWLFGVLATAPWLLSLLSSLLKRE
jgi:hypothetical protein